MSQDYNETLNLPKTDFPMRAGLAKREPDMLRGFEERRVYETLLEKNAGKPLFILHDGPPFSNGDIHLGHAVNKLLKDFIVRYKNMTGFRSPYVPGWDNHGMPIESAIIKKNKLDRKSMSVPEFRDACRAFALDFVNRQREQFKRLGVLGDWENPYLTMDPAFEAEEIRVFGAMYEKGYIYRGMKPVYWCPSDETALAEAEIEYEDDPCTAIYVKFKVESGNGLLPEPDSTYFVIWTTTTWTIPGNLAICLNPDLEYALVKAGGETYIIADALVDTVCAKAGIADFEIVGRRFGRDLERVTARHPLYERDSLVILGNHVTTEAGTGCVHTAPGFGVDDFNVCRKYPEIPMLVPVDTRGIMTEDAGVYAGQHYSKANDAILADLDAGGALLASERITHSYPHCWRCKNPIIFRATEQWFSSVDAIKDAAAAACADITWYPEWGRERMVAMIHERSDWCISRQRHWGLPIPVFYCGDCEKPVCTPESIEAVADLFAAHGSNAWFDREAEDILPQGFTCPHCGGIHFAKGADTLDGWFDSGSTHAAVLEKFAGLQSPADVYLEGGDQYRGWFQSSMLTSIATRGRAPYRIVITNGWALDGEGRTMHKSLGNVISPEEIVREYGADVLRLWVSSTDYHANMRLSKEVLKQMSDMYLKIRNTARYILGNLGAAADGSGKFDPGALVPFAELEPLDRWAVSRLNELVRRVREAYDAFEYHTVCHGIHNFCAVELSNFYLDVIKDRLYCDTRGSKSGRSARTAIYLILDHLVRLLAPILAFTAEEIWAELPHGAGADTESVLFNDMPSYNADFTLAPDAEEMWERLLALRGVVNRALESARAEKIIGKPLDAEVTLFVAPNAPSGYDAALALELAPLFVVSRVTVLREAVPGAIHGISAEVRASGDPKCPRCWTHGGETDADGLCPRCKEAVSERRGSRT